MDVAFVASGLTFNNVGGIMIRLNSIVAKAYATSKRAWERSTSASVERQMNITHRVAAIFGSMLVVIACSIGLPSQASALTLTESSGEFLGSFHPAHPSSPAVEVDYINVLIDLSTGTSGFFDAGTGQTYDRSLNTPAGCCDDAVLAGNSLGDDQPTTIDVTGFTYLLAKYDAEKGGDLVWYVGNLTGLVDIQSTFGSCGANGCGLSHWDLFNPEDGHASPTDTVPEPATLLLFGAGLIAMSRFARKLK
jgi:PEP-CTERM motif